MHPLMGLPNALFCRYAMTLVLGAIKGYMTSIACYLAMIIILSIVSIQGQTSLDCSPEATLICWLQAQHDNHSGGELRIKLCKDA